MKDHVDSRIWRKKRYPGREDPRNRVTDLLEFTYVSGSGGRTSAAVRYRKDWRTTAVRGTRRVPMENTTKRQTYVNLLRSILPERKRSA